MRAPVLGWVARLAVVSTIPVVSGAMNWEISAPPTQMTPPMTMPGPTPIVRRLIGNSQVPDAAPMRLPAEVNPTPRVAASLEKIWWRSRRSRSGWSAAFHRRRKCRVWPVPGSLWASLACPRRRSW